MRRTGWGIALGAPGLLAVATGAQADTPGELAERLRKATTVLTEMAEGATMQPDGSAIRTRYGAKADSRDVLLGGRYAVPAAARAFVNALMAYSPPPKKH